MAVDWALGMKFPDQRKESLGSAFAEWIKADPEAAGERYAQVSEEVATLSDHMAYSLEYPDPEAVLLWADKFLPGHGRKNLVGNVARQLSDPERIASIHGKLENDRSKKAFMTNLLLNWNDRDVEAGYHWIRNSSTEENIETRLSMLAGSVASHQFDNAMEFSKTIENPEHRELFRNRLIRNLAEEFPQKALALAKETGNDKLYYATLNRAINWHDEYDNWRVEEIAEMLRELPPDHPTDAVSSLGHRWYREDPDGAVAWMHSLEPSKQRRQAINSVLGQMARTKPDAAAEQASQFTAPEDRNEAYATLARQQRDRDPATAFRFANQVGYAQRRNPLLHDIVQTWAMRDPAAAREAIASATALDARTKSRLLARIYD